jgi:nitrile hydratase
MSSHSHSHGHSHPHIPTPKDGDPPTRYMLMGLAVRELLIEKGVVTGEALDEAVADMDARSPSRGARVVARAWTDPAYKERLMSTGAEAVEEMGIAIEPTILVVVENTPEVHNVVVCTLCSCYPRMLLGRPPDWYKSRPYRSRVVNEPRAVLREFGTELPDDVAVRVHDSTADMRYMVLPMRPEGTEGMSEEDLAALVTRDSMVGVSLPKTP